MAASVDNDSANTQSSRGIRAMGHQNNQVFSILTTFFSGESVMKKLSQIVATAGIILAAAVAARADSITGVLSSSSSTAADISSGTADWVYYGRNSDNTAMELDYKSGGSQSFSDLTVNNSSGSSVTANWWPHGSSVLTPITFTGGTPTASKTSTGGYRYFQAASGDDQGDNISFTHTLLSTSETINLYMVAFASNKNYTCDLSAALGSGKTYSISGVSLPTNDNSGGDPGHYAGTWTLNVSGSVGDTLTIKMATTSTGYSNIGIQAASATVNNVPEPTSAIMLSSVLIGLLCYAWRKWK